MALAVPQVALMAADLSFAIILFGALAIADPNVPLEIAPLAASVVLAAQGHARFSSLDRDRSAA